MFRKLLFVMMLCALAMPAMAKEKQVDIDAVNKMMHEYVRKHPRNAFNADAANRMMREYVRKHPRVAVPQEEPKVFGPAGAPACPPGFDCPPK